MYIAYWPTPKMWFIGVLYILDFFEDLICESDFTLKQKEWAIDQLMVQNNVHMTFFSTDFNTYVY